MPRVETRESENDSTTIYMQNDEVMCHTIQGFAGNPCNSRRPQHHASIDTRGNNGSLWRHFSLAAGLCVDDVTIGHQLLILK